MWAQVDKHLTISTVRSLEWTRNSGILDIVTFWKSRFPDLGVRSGELCVDFFNVSARACVGQIGVIPAQNHQTCHQPLHAYP